MIKSLKIINFQSHSHSLLKFHKGVNLILGESDSGKTAIIRALNWVINNQPSGTSFYSLWGGETKVILNIDKWNVLRVKNLYRRFKNNEDVRYTSFRQGVPEEIKQLLNFSSLNLQNQFDSPFLLSQSSGEVARVLNDIAHLDKVDTAVSNINRTLIQERRSLKVQEELLEEGRDKLKKLNWLPEAEGCLNKLSIFNNKIKTEENKADSLFKLTKEIGQIKEELKRYKQLEEMEEALSILINSNENIKERENKAERLRALVTEANRFSNEINQTEKETINLEKEFKKLMPKGSQCPLCGGIVK